MAYASLSTRKRLGACARTLFLVALLPFFSYGQQWELGAGLGGVNYKGDVAPSFQPKFYRLGGNLFVRYNAGRAISFKLGLMLGRAFAEDRGSSDPLNQTRNLDFRTSITELSPQVEYNFLNYRDAKTRQNWTPYLFTGLALFSFNGEDSNGNDYSGTQLSIPFGIGVKYVLSQNWNLGFEFGARKTFTDQLDGGPVVNTPLLSGNPRTKDMYFYTGIMLSYTFYKVHCPDFY